MKSARTGNDYRRKIKSREELAAIIGPRPRAQTVIMCHGTFDLVHPGHIRHLMYAKAKADVLIASLTGDDYITKANFRPFVPQELRAMNLAAREIVDYVLIDHSATPIDSLQTLQPDFFAKGYEYTERGLHPQTRVEVETLNSYGGEILFTPGDIVFSSSAFIESGLPALAIEKLGTLMESEGVTCPALREAVQKFRGVRVHVVGDTIVDTHTQCTTINTGSVKTPTLSVKYERHADFAGAAAVVAGHLAAAGARVRFSTVLGGDALKDFVIREVTKAGVEGDFVIDVT